jgi:hypothetical protein
MKKESLFSGRGFLFLLKNSKTTFCRFVLALGLDVYKKITRKFAKRLDKTAGKW